MARRKDYEVLPSTERETDDGTAIDICNGVETFKKVLRERGISKRDLKLVVVGRTGRGKSTLINSIIEQGGMVAKEGAGEDAVTKEVNLFVYKNAINGVGITLVDSPGLQDFTESKQSFNKLVQELKSKGDNANLVLYCADMSDMRIENDEIITMRKLYQAFGPEFWKRVVVVLTFANKEDCEKQDDRDDDVKGEEPPYSDKVAWSKLIKRRFIGRIQRRKEKFMEVMKVVIHIPTEIVEKMMFVPAGNYVMSRRYPAPFHLPDRENWLYDLLKCCTDHDCLSLPKLKLRDNLHLAVIIDNDGEVDQESGEYVQLNDQAAQIKDALENQLKFHVLSFHNLSSESIAYLAEVICSIDQSELAAFVLIILSKGKACDEVNFESICSPFSRSLVKVPIIFFARFQNSKNSLALPEVLPSNSVLLTVTDNSTDGPTAVGFFIKKLEKSFAMPIKECFEEMRVLTGMTCTCIDTIVLDNLVLPAIYEPFNGKIKVDFVKKKLNILRFMWRDVRCKTIDILYKNKDEVRKLLPIARIGTSVVGIVFGIAAALFTFGASVPIGLSVAGGAFSKVMANSRLKKAQWHISFDQQLSKNLNQVASEYSKVAQQHAEIIATATGSGLSTAASIGGRIGMATAVGVEGVVETSALALRTTGRVAGMAVAGVSLAVTIPIDIAFIAYHSYIIHQARKDESGEFESDVSVKWFIQQIETLFKDTFSIDVKEYVTAIIDNPECGYLLEDKSNYTITVRTLFSGPFNLPKGATLVSAVYDISINKELKGPVSIQIEHCVDTVDTKKMSFATGAIDLVKKKFNFTSLEGDGNFDEKKGTISVNESCILCIISTESVPLKYTALCSFESGYKSSTNMSVFFTKRLKSHYKFVQNEFGIHKEPEYYDFTFTGSSDTPSIEFEGLKSDIRDYKGWIISPNHIPDQITKEELDTIELQKPNSKLLSVTKIPFIELHIQVYDEENAIGELEHVLLAGGTDLKLPIRLKKNNMKGRL